MKWKTENFYTVELAAKELDLNSRILTEKTRNNEIQAFKKGKRLYYLHSELIRYVTGKQAKYLNETIYTASGAANALGISKRNLLDLLRSGQLVGYKTAKQWYLLQSDLIRWITK